MHVVSILIFFLFFPENWIRHSMQIVNGDILHEMSNPVSRVLSVKLILLDRKLALYCDTTPSYNRLSLSRSPRNSL